MNQQFDCVVIGAGIVGLTTVLALAQNGFQVALVEASPLEFNYSPEKFDLRVSAITRASEHIFKNLGVWDAIADERISPYQIMRVWEEKGEGAIEFNAAKIAEPNLGHIIENRVIRKHLLQKIQEYENISIFSPYTCQDFYHHNNSIVLQMEGYQEIESKLLVGADGAKSWLRTRAEFELEEKDYNHYAVVATIKTELPHNKIARQRFLHEGILAFLPLIKPHFHSIVWSTEPNKAKSLIEMDKEDFNEQLSKAFSNVLGKIELVSERISYPLFMRHVKSYIKPRIALIGDAAHTVHPLAGQGVNLGLLDAAVLVDVLSNAKQKDRDFGLMQHLRKYERARKSENQRMLLAMSGFKNLFGHDSSAIVWARNAGLNLTDRAEPVKNLFIKKAMGLIGDLPRLAKLGI